MIVRDRQTRPLFLFLVVVVVVVFIFALFIVAVFVIQLFFYAFMRKNKTQGRKKNKEIWCYDAQPYHY